MASRSKATGQLHRLFDQEVLDIHGVAELLGMQRSSINTLIVRKGSTFPQPIFEVRGEKRHLLRLWSRADIEVWKVNRKRYRERN